VMNLNLLESSRTNKDCEETVLGLRSNASGG
jgi:hypothetical protein